MEDCVYVCVHVYAIRCSAYDRYDFRNYREKEPSGNELSTRQVTVGLLMWPLARNQRNKQTLHKLNLHNLHLSMHIYPFCIRFQLFLITIILFLPCIVSIVAFLLVRRQFRLNSTRMRSISI